VSYFKSSLDTKILDTLWNTYWINTLSANPLVTNAGYITSQIHDLGAKLEQIGSKSTSVLHERLSKLTKDSGR
jgi:COP9 signalosome complex subunit 5